MRERFAASLFVVLFAVLTTNIPTYAGTSIVINHADIDPSINELQLTGINFDSFGQPTITAGDTVLGNCVVLSNEITCPLEGTPAQNGGTWKVKVSAGNSPSTNAEINVFNRAGITANSCITGDMVECYPGDSATRGVGECQTGYRNCGSNGEWSICQGEILPSAEDCFSSRDEDCDDLIGLDDPDCSSVCSDQGLSQCATSCVDTNTDKNNCGSCGVVCVGAFDNCIAGECVTPCNLSISSLEPNPVCNTFSNLEIAIHGTGFSPLSTLDVGGMTMRFFYDGPDTLVFELPDYLPTGDYDINIRNWRGCETTKVDALQVQSCLTQ